MPDLTHRWEMDCTCRLGNRCESCGATDDLRAMAAEVQPENGKPLGKKGLAWIAERYGDRPAGHPLWTERPTAIATRHVDGRSPWGGFDLGYHRDKITDRKATA